MKTIVMLAILVITIGASARNIATCETPIIGDPSFKIYIYEDQDGQTKADVWQKVNGGHLILLKGLCLPPTNSTFGDTASLICYGRAFDKNSRCIARTIFHQTNKEDVVVFRVICAPNDRVIVGATNKCL